MGAVLGSAQFRGTNPAHRYFAHSSPAERRSLARSALDACWSSETEALRGDVKGYTLFLARVSSRGVPVGVSFCCALCADVRKSCTLPSPSGTG